MIQIAALFSSAVKSLAFALSPCGALIFCQS
jgi:hypothetical protein